MIVFCISVTKPFIKTRDGMTMLGGGDGSGKITSKTVLKLTLNHWVYNDIKCTNVPYFVEGFRCLLNIQGESLFKGGKSKSNQNKFI